MSTLLGEARVRIRPDTAGFLSQTQRDISKHGTALGKTFSSAFKVGAVGLAAITGAAALAAKNTLDIGTSYQNSLNTLQSVSQATAAQMAAVGKTAKALGQDMTLPATSAADAADVMTELAKASFSVEDAQIAAKGSLQLAAAAQIDGAKAATIQANALLAFNLKASDAGKVADILANAANASSAEITDVADSLQQAGAVAAGAKISLTDTATAIGILANNGIKGADAGTLLKSALLAMRNTSKPAHAAMKSLNLEVYDAKGNFVGLKSIFGQLATAQKRMSQQSYEAATNMLFGSDASRLAAVAAKEGIPGWDKISTAMHRTGSAAQIAAARSKGVGGALQALKSQVETFQIDLFERAAPNIEKLVRFAAENFPKVGDAIFNGIDHGLAGIGRFKNEAVKDFKAVRDYLEPVTSEVVVFVQKLGESGGIAQSFFGVLKVGGTVLLDVAKALHPLVSLTGGILHLFNALPGPVKSVIAGLVALKVAANVDIFGKLAGRKGVAGSVGGFGQSLTGFAQTVKMNMSLAGEEVGRVQRITGGLAAGFQTYMPTATKALGNFTASVKSAADQARQLQRYKITEAFGAGAVGKSTGDLKALGAAAKTAAIGGIGALKSAGSGLVGFLGGPWGAAFAAGSIAVAAITSKMADSAAQAASWGDALVAGGTKAQKALNDARKADLTFDPMGAAASIFSWDFRSNTEKAKAAFNDVRSSMTPLERATSDVSARTADLSAAYDQFGKGSVETMNAAAALRTAQKNLADETNHVKDAAEGATGALLAQTQASLASTNTDLAASMAQNAFDQQLQSSAATIAQFGAKSLEGKAATDQLAQAALTAANAAAAQAAAHSKASDDTGKQVDADRALLDSLKKTAAQMGKATPESITKLISSLEGSAGSAALVSSKLQDVALQVYAIPGSKDVNIYCPTDAQVKALQDLGYTVTTLPDGTVRVSANTDAAAAAMEAFAKKQWSIQVTANITARVNRENKDFVDSWQGGPITPAHKAIGGLLTGPGTGTSDSIPVWGSNGEFVIKAKSVAKYGVGLMHDINSGRFANGGEIGGSKSTLLPREPALTSAGRSTQDSSFTYAPTFVVDPRNGSVRDQMGDAMFELRRLRRGGRTP